MWSGALSVAFLYIKNLIVGKSGFAPLACGDVALEDTTNAY